MKTDHQKGGNDSGVAESLSLPRVIMGGAPLLGRLTGIGHYTRQLAVALQEHGLLADLQLWSGLRFLDESFTQLSEEANRGSAAAGSRGLTRRTVTRALRQLSSGSRIAVRAYSFVTEHISARRLDRFAGSYVYHSPNFILPPYRGPQVVTVHDLSVIKFPHFHRRQMVEICEKGILSAIERGSEIIVDSELVRREVLDTFGVKEALVSTVHLAPDVRCRPRNEGECRPALEPLGLRYRGFFLCVGTVEPRKNLLRLFSAYRAGRQEGLFDWPLVVVGLPGWKSDAEHEALRALCKAGWAIYLNYIDDATLHVLYSATRLLAFPSLYEGFGLPAVEAVASGSPVLTSRGSAMQEVVGSEAVLVDPMDIGALKMGLCEGSVASAPRLVPETPVRTWRQVAEETSAVYGRLLA
ncbi:glycosyltransferase family 4 protein [bacterium]|nr:glycosyltransferase family 4 protein [bacterium]